MLDIICVYLEAKGYRRNQSFWAVLSRQWALEYLLSQIHQIPEADSFDGSLAVFAHPLPGRHVAALFYEVDLLHSLRPLQPQDGVESWEKSTVVHYIYVGSLK